MEQPQIRYTKTSDGVSIAYVAMGRGPVVVYMPFMPLTHVELEWKVDDLRQVIELAASASTFIRYDGRGFGLSDHRDDFTLDAMVADLEAVAHTFKPRPFALMAAEHMAIPALAYAARHPERVAALVLWLGVQRGEDMFGGRLNTLVDLARNDWEYLKESFSHTMGFDSASANRAFQQLANEATTQDSWIAFMEAMRSWDATDLLHEVRVPALVLARREFRLIPIETIRTLAAALRNGEFVTLEGAATAMTTPDVGAAITAFLTRILVPAPPFQAPEPVTSGIAEIAASPSDRRSVHGTAIILFADVVDSTAIAGRIGNAAFRERTRQLEEALRTVMREAGGAPVEGRTLGDGVIGVFTSAAQAIDAALQCGQHADRVELQLHLGIHAGDVIHEAGNVSGVAVSMAARISDLTGPNQILVSSTVRDLARASTDVTFEDHGEHALKGVAEPQRVYIVRSQP